MGATRNELIRAFVPHSPFACELGLEIAHVDAAGCRLTMPFRPELATFGETVHGGAIAALIDTAGMVAAWGDESEPSSPQGATVAMSVDFVAAATGRDLTATARVLRRGKRLCFVAVDVEDPEGGLVAAGLVTHRFG